MKLRKRGLSVSGSQNLEIKASQTKEGTWLAWLELDGEPLLDQNSKPRLFEGFTRYQAQCAAHRWCSDQETV